MTKTVCLKGTYSEHCFCTRPPMTVLSRLPYYPRFEFAKYAKLFAQENKLTWGGLNKYKSAWAVLLEPCAHREQQTVRIDWELEY